MFGLLFPRLRLCVNFDKKRIGLHFGRHFSQLAYHAFIDCWIGSGLPDFNLVQGTKTGKIGIPNGNKKVYQMEIKYFKWPLNM
jgi:hypothetical protein